MSQLDQLFHTTAFFEAASWVNHVDAIAGSIILQPELINELWDIIQHGDETAWRAAWTMEKINDKRPEMIYPFLNELIIQVEKTNNNGLKRHFLKMISIQPLPKDLSGYFVDFCFKILLSSDEPIAVRVHAMQILYNICQKIPDLKNELIESIESIQSEASAGIKSKSRKLLKHLKKE
jgi:hypothetical protein